MKNSIHTLKITLDWELLMLVSTIDRSRPRGPQLKNEKVKL